VQSDSKIVASAKGMIPRQPVAEHRRLIGKELQHFPEHLLVRGQHAVRGDYALRQSRGPGGVQDFGDGIWVDAAICFILDFAAPTAKQLPARSNTFFVSPESP
jgi:hypothetical protein